MVDSGVDVNVINQSAWKYLKRQKVKVQYQTNKVKRRLLAYGNNQLNVLGMFVADIATKQSTLSDKIFVVKEPGSNLLGR